MQQIPDDLINAYYKWIDDIHEIQLDCEIELTENKTSVKYVGKEQSKDWLIFVDFVRDFMIKFFENKKEIDRQKRKNAGVKYG